MAGKFRAHETFFIRKGWLSKGMRHIVAKPNVFTDRNENATDVLGIGANMVKSLRYWLQAVNLATESKTGVRGQALTTFGELVYKYDRYIEEIGTLYLLHYHLVKDRNVATSWFYFYNKFLQKEFTKEEFVDFIQNQLKMEDENVALRSLTDDFSCIVNTYIPRYKLDQDKMSPENNINCPLGELGLIDILSKERGNIIYKKSIPMVSSIHPFIAYAILVDQAAGRNEILLNDILTADSNLGKVLNLDSIAMLDVLRTVEQRGLIKIVRTAGLDVIKLNDLLSFDECVKRYYVDIEGEEE